MWFSVLLLNYCWVLLLSLHKPNDSVKKLGEWKNIWNSALCWNIEPLRISLFRLSAIITHTSAVAHCGHHAPQEGLTAPAKVKATYLSHLSSKSPLKWHKEKHKHTLSSTKRTIEEMTAKKTLEAGKQMGKTWERWKPGQQGLWDPEARKSNSADES